MIASVRGLAVLGAIAVVLAVVLAVLGPREVGPVDRALVPKLDVGSIDGVEMQRTGDRSVALVRTGGHWLWKDPPGAADQSTIDAMLTAVRGAHWHRAGGSGALGAVRATVRLHAGASTVQLAVGADLPGAEQTWLSVDGRVVLVDRWVAEALSPEPIGLRLRQPFVGALSARVISGGSVRLEGVHRTSPSPVWVDPDRVNALQRALANVEVVALPDVAPGALQEHVVFDGPDGSDVARAGSCAEHRVLIAAKTGAGCVDPTRWRDVLAAIQELEGPPEVVTSLRPLPLPAVKLRFGDGPTLDLTGQPRLDDDDADATKAAELMAALTAPAELVPHPPGKVRSVIRAEGAGIAELSLELYDGVIARAGESFALRPKGEAWAVIARPPGSLRDPVLWREEATTITSMVVDGATYVRGPVLGEWTREAAGAAGSAAPPVDSALVDALATELAIVRGPAITAAEAARDPLLLDVTVTFTPPAGAPATHKLSIGALAADGCPARVDGATVRLDPALCTAAHALGE